MKARTTVSTSAKTDINVGEISQAGCRHKKEKIEKGHRQTYKTKQGYHLVKRNASGQKVE